MQASLRPLHSLLALIAATFAAGAGASDWQTIAPGGETRCATGAPFEFHVRRADPERLMIFFNGGGACWSARTCDVNGAPDADPSYRPVATLEAGNHPGAFDGAFAPNREDNPFAGWSQVFVSYCTGDVHLGTADRRYERADGSTFSVHHRGRINAQAALDYVYAHFEQPEKVFVAGGSAGAVASPFYAGLLADHYGQADVVHFAGGSGTYQLGTPTQLWQLWGVFDALPALYADSGRTAANTSLLDLYRMADSAVEGIAFHQFDHAYDATQAAFQKALGKPIDSLKALNANRARLRGALSRFEGYTAPGDFHTVLRYGELYEQVTGGVPAVDWVRRVAAGEAVDSVHCGEAPDCR